MLESIRKDITYAWRSIRRSPGFFAVAMLSLGLGVGVNTAMFSLVDALLFRPLLTRSRSTTETLSRSMPPESRWRRATIAGTVRSTRRKSRYLCSKSGPSL